MLNYCEKFILYIDLYNMLRFIAEDHDRIGSDFTVFLRSSSDHLIKLLILLTANCMKNKFDIFLIIQKLNQ
jgi:hypothetical protein